MPGPDITIEDVHLKLEEPGVFMEGKVWITLKLRNNSKTLKYYVLKRPRNIEYDKRSQTLSIGLYEKVPPPAIKVSSIYFEPEQVAISPDTTLQWKYLLPVWMKKITRPRGSNEIVEVLDISGVQKVKCTIAYDTSPFRLKPPDDRQDVSMALSQWGETVFASFDRTIEHSIK